MHRSKITDGAKLHYTSIIGRGPSVPVTVKGKPYQLGGPEGSWSAWVMTEDRPSGFSVTTEALFEFPISEGDELYPKDLHCELLTDAKFGECDAILDQVVKMERGGEIKAADLVAFIRSRMERLERERWERISTKKLLDDHSAMM